MVAPHAALNQHDRRQRSGHDVTLLQQLVPRGREGGNRTGTEGGGRVAECVRGVRGVRGSEEERNSNRKRARARYRPTNRPRALVYYKLRDS